MEKMVVIDTKKNAFFDSFYNLLAQSFPNDEIRPYERQKDLLQIENYRAFVQWDDHRMVGLITVWLFPGFSFIEHFAVVPELRSQGIGSRILQETLAFLPKPVILEAELPETALAQRRLAFYARHGFHENPYFYVQPAYSADRNSVPMRLLSTNPLSERDYAAVRAEIYRQVYHVETE